MSYPIYYVEEGDVLPVFFDTFEGSTGASVTLSGLAVTDIEIYKDGSATQRASDAGYTLLDTDGIDFDGITGIHGFSIDLSNNTDAGFYVVGSWYHVVVSSITVDGQTVNFVAAAFRIVSATRGLAGTALPNAAADAAGGLPISDAGGLDLDTILGRITGNVALASVLGALTDSAATGDPGTSTTTVSFLKQLINVLVGSAGIATFPASAAPADGVSLAEVLRAVYDDTNSLDGTKVPDTISLANINAQVDTAIETYHLDHLLAATYDPASKPGAADALLNELVEDDGGVARFTANALEQAPSGTGGDATAANQATILAKLLAYFQLALRKDAAIATDNATELTAINADGGSGAGAFANTADSAEAIRDRGDAAWVTGGGSAVLEIASGTIANASTTAVDLGALTFSDDTLNDLLIRIYDDSAGEYHSRWISSYTNVASIAVLSEALPFTTETGVDTYVIYAIRRDGQRLADAAHGGTSAVLTLERMVVASTTTDEPAVKLTGDGIAAGMEVYGGASAVGAKFEGQSGGIQARAIGSGNGITARGEGIGNGINAIGGITDGTAGIKATSAATNGDGMQLVGTGTGLDLDATTTDSLEVNATAVADKTGYSLSAAGIDAILDEPVTEPGGVFAWGSATLRNIIGWLGALSRNKMAQTATTQTLRNDADSADIATSAVSDDGTTATRGEFS